MKLNPVTPYTKINPKWIIDLYLQYKTKILEGNIEENLHDLGANDKF